MHVCKYVLQRLIEDQSLGRIQENNMKRGMVVYLLLCHFNDLFTTQVASKVIFIMHRRQTCSTYQRCIHLSPFLAWVGRQQMDKVCKEIIKWRIFSTAIIMMPSAAQSQREKKMETQQRAAKQQQTAAAVAQAGCPLLCLLNNCTALSTFYYYTTCLIDSCWLLHFSWTHFIVIPPLERAAVGKLIVLPVWIRRKEVYLIVLSLQQCCRL